MDQDTVISLANAALQLALKVALPLLLTGLIIGVVISIIQSITQIQEQTLVFIPKMLGAAAVLVIAGPWMLNQLLSYATDLWASIPRLIGVT